MRFFLFATVLPGSILSSLVHFSFVDLIFLTVWSICLFSVARLFGIWWLTCSTLSPGHVRKNSFSMTLSHIDTTGIKAAACKYFTCSDIVAMWYKLLSCCVGRVIGICLFLPLFSNVTHQSPVQCYLFPMRIFYPFCLIGTSSLSNNAVQTASHNLPMNISEMCMRPGILCSSLSTISSCRSLSLH